MTQLKDIVETLLQELKEKQKHAEALPDLSISLLQSYVDDDQIPESLVINHIHGLIAEDGFPPDKKQTIEKLLSELPR